jgi:putative endonuclease
MPKHKPPQIPDRQSASKSERGVKAHALGLRAERLAAVWLRLKGYRILARRFKTPVGEIDLIVRRGRTIAFVEVKARADLADAAHAISPQARTRIEKAAEWFLSRRVMAQPPHKKAEMLRFDMVLVIPGRRPHHITNAWTAGLS